MLDAVLEVKKVLKKPLAVRPNSGSTKSVGGRYLDLCSPEYLAHFTKEYFTAGVSLLVAAVEQVLSISNDGKCPKIQQSLSH